MKDSDSEAEFDLSISWTKAILGAVYDLVDFGDEIF